jgi:hypothetical protein
MAMSRDICSCLLRRTARSFAPFAPAPQCSTARLLSQKRKHLKLAGATPWAKINRNTRVTGATAIPFRPVVMQPTVAVALMTRSTPPQPHFEASCVASHGTPDKSGRIDLLKERYVSRDGVHGIAAAANVRYTDVPIRHQSQRPPTCTAHHCNIAPRVPPHGCPPARKCPVRCRPRQRFPRRVAAYFPELRFLVHWLRRADSAAWRAK